MGHYSEAYEHDEEKNRLAKIKMLKNALKEFQDFRMWRTGRLWNLSYIPEAEKLFNQIITNIKAELYTLGDR